jgi:DMSO/TMAO reductase YedYZ heme-binding membrane subunit
MARLPRRLWRRVHMASFLVFAATSVHALTAGTDRRSAAFLVAVALACGVVALLTAIRVWKSLPAGPRQRDVSTV